MTIVISGDCDRRGKGEIFFVNISKEIWRKKQSWEY
jgi:hypothetical protein